MKLVLFACLLGAALGSCKWYNYVKCGAKVLECAAACCLGACIEDPACPLCFGELAGDCLPCLEMIDDAGWLPVEREVPLQWDLDSKPLEFITDSELKSNDTVIVDFFSAEEEIAGYVWLEFKSDVKYSLGECDMEDFYPLSNDLPSAREKFWRITLTNTAGVRVVIHCNGVEVLNKLLSTCDARDWGTYWNRDVTKIKFRSTDTASDYYGPQPEIDESEEDDESEQGDNQNCSAAAALKVSSIFLVVLLFAVNMSI